MRHAEQQLLSTLLEPDGKGITDDEATIAVLERVSPRLVSMHSEVVSACRGKSLEELISSNDFDLINRRMSAWNALLTVAELTDVIQVNEYLLQFSCSEDAWGDGVESL
jgi:hypothetical protein